MAGIGTPAARLDELRGAGCTPQQAWELFDSLPGVRVEEVTTGRWRGGELDTGHPWKGVLVGSGWYGKQFDSADSVQPLLFAGPDERVFPVDPRRVPLGLAGRIPLVAVRFCRRLLPLLRPVLHAGSPCARLRDLEFRGKVGAAMVYDHLPIIDCFRLVDGDTLLGVMDMRGMSDPYFFILSRDRS